MSVRHFALSVLLLSLTLTHFALPVSASDLSSGDIISFAGARYVVLDDDYTDANAISQGTAYIMALSAVAFRPFNEGGTSNLPDITNSNNLLYYLNSPNSGNFYADIGAYYQSWIAPTNYGVGDCTDLTTGCDLSAQNSAVKQLYVATPSLNEWNTANSIYSQARYGEAFNGTDDYFLLSALLRNPLTDGDMTGLDSSGAPTSFPANTPSAIYPTLNLKSTLITCAGSGTFADPYYLGDGDCSNVLKPAEPPIGTLESLKTKDIVQISELIMKIGDYHEQLTNKRLFVSIDSPVSMADTSAEDIDDLDTLEYINFGVDYCRVANDRTTGGCASSDLVVWPQAVTLKRDVYVIDGQGTRADPYQTLHADTINHAVTEELDLRFAGYLFYESSTSAQTDGLVFVRDLENNFAIYKRDLPPLPDSATSSATIPYYFLVNYFTTNPKLGEMVLVP